MGRALMRRTELAKQIRKVTYVMEKGKRVKAYAVYKLVDVQLYSHAHSQDMKRSAKKEG